eukprot:CAMPEP_0184725186 /NCGR_PEP_ID=MMETSP0314-20130426/30165_1 /TAXON_ID=38298 /ORGANISM="Rhodella maculata, Strain CCMP 736" /LENGTH=280 /DNA_ID=CAMNT_0027190349 /DNA_START=15 /DNA_END=854 /DNA_ORIENTATION=-
MTDKEFFSRQDPYVEARISHGTDVRRTKTKNEAGKHASWNQELIFDVTETSRKNLRLHCRVMDANIGRDRLIGTVEADCSSVATGHKGIDRWFPMSDARNKKSGELHLDISYIPLAAALGSAYPAPPPNSSNPYAVSSGPSHYGAAQPINPAHGPPPGAGQLYGAPPTSFATQHSSYGSSHLPPPPSYGSNGPPAYNPPPPPNSFGSHGPPSYGSHGPPSYPSQGPPSYGAPPPPPQGQYNPYAAPPPPPGQQQGYPPQHHPSGALPGYPGGPPPQGYPG